MTRPDRPPETRTVLGSFSFGDPPIRAILMRVQALGRADRFEADVMLNGQAVETITAATCESILGHLEGRYGPPHPQAWKPPPGYTDA